MKWKITTVIPVYNGERFIAQTLESLAKQTRPADRIVVLDNCSTDRTEEIVRGFKNLPIEFRRNERNIGLFGNLNRSLTFAPETDYLHILHADDMIEPKFYEVLAGGLDDCDGYGLAYSLDERVDEENRHLSMSGKADGRVVVESVDEFLRQKAEISNQAFSATLMKSHYQPAPGEFRSDMLILADMMYWPEWGRHCKKIVKANQPLTKYRWHGDNMTNNLAPTLQSLILDEWLVMQGVEKMRGDHAGAVRWFKLKGLFAVRSGIKAKRFMEQKNLDYSRQITSSAKAITGPFIWFLGRILVETRDLVVYKIQGRRKHPKNVYS